MSESTLTLVTYAIFGYDLFSEVADRRYEIYIPLHIVYFFE